MRLSVVTDEISQDLPSALRIMAEYGIREAELSNVYRTDIVEADENLLQRVASDLRDYGMSVPCIDTPLFDCGLGGFSARTSGELHGAAERGAGKQLQLLQHSIDLCRRFDCRYLRIFSFRKHGPLSPEVEDRIADALVRPAEIAARAGITLLLENDTTCFLRTGKETARVIEKVGSPSLKMLWNPGNAFTAGEQPFPSGFDAGAKHVAHMHLKDARSFDDGRVEWTTFGQGEIDYTGQFRALKAAGFDGVLSLEPRNRENNGNQDHASRQCLDGLVRLLAAA